MKNKILELINSGMSVEEVTEKVYENECMAMEFKEDFPNHCHEDADCFDCWKQKVIKISEGEDILKNNKERVEFKNIQQLIDYLEAVKEQSGEDTEVRVDGQVIREFDDYIDVNHVEDYIDFVTPNYIL